jgi:hypothetical protein
MSEFSNKTKSQLELILNSLESYKQGSYDTFKMIEDMHKKTMDFYENKIILCKKEIEKYNKE